MLINDIKYEYNIKKIMWCIQGLPTRKVYGIRAKKISLGDLRYRLKYKCGIKLSKYMLRRMLIDLRKRKKIKHSRLLKGYYYTRELHEKNRKFKRYKKENPGVIHERIFK